jgi:3-deoxy-D-manno-octulosonic acid kinase
MNPITEAKRPHLDESRLRLHVADEFSERAVDAGLTHPDGFDRMLQTARSVPGGRSAHRILDAKSPPIRLRPYEHGGLLGSILGGRFLAPNRPIREFRLWTTLRARGAPMPRPVLAASRRRGAFWQSIFGSVDHELAKDGAGWLATAPCPVDLRMGCIAFARAARRFHDAGGLHGDLHLRNVLIETCDSDRMEPTFRCMLIDLDRGRVLRRVSPRQRMIELMRFTRSLEKAGRGDLLSIRFRALALSAYCARDRPLRRSMLRWAPYAALDVYRHRVAWRIGRREHGLSESPPR